MSAEPRAWELLVRRTGGDPRWVRYALYETKAQAEGTLNRVKGPPLELKLVPLYRRRNDPRTGL